MNNVHDPKRLTGETFDDYKKRRKLSTWLVKNHKFFHVSSWIEAKTTKVFDKNTNKIEEHYDKDDKGNIIYERKTKTYRKNV